MLDKLLTPFIELLLLLIFLSKVPNKQFTAKAIFINLLSLAAYIYLRITLIDNYDASVMVCRILFFSIFCSTFCDIPAPNAAFLSACLSLILHAVILFYYNLPFLSHFAKQWLLGDSILITLIRLPLILSLRKSVSDISHSDIELLEYLLILISYLGYIIDIRHILAVSMSQTSDVETTILLFAYCFATILAIYAAFWHIASRRHQAEAARMNALLEQQYIMWGQKAERDKAIRRMYHDMKNQINLITALESETARDLTSALKQSMERYSRVPDTGNAILNTLLNEKANYCMEHQIAFHCITNFQSLSPIKGLDLCAIVGNAVDNAITAVLALDDPDQREIDIKISQHDGFLIFRFDNCYAGELHPLGNQLFATTKKDKAHHGIGLSSIQNSAEKYGGHMLVEADQGQFSLKVVIPRPQ